MNQIAKLTLSLLAGFALGAGAIQGLHAQAQKKPAYLIADVKVTDPPVYKDYVKKAVATLKPYGAKVMALGKPEAKEGTPPQGNIVIVRFDSIADLEKWYSTPPYQPLIAERHKSAKTNLFFVEGTPQ